MIDLLRVETREPWEQKTAADGTATTLERARRNLLVQITARIEARLPGRIRGLAVALKEDKIVLSGRCNTYYSKQMAQHVALGLLDDQPLVNQIEVIAPRCGSPIGIRQR